MRILYFYPENPLLLTQGNNARALSLLHYFKERNIDVDFVSEQSKFFDEVDLNQLKEKGLINQGHLLKRFQRSKHQLRYFFYFSLPNKIFKKIKHFQRSIFGHQERFDQILKNNSYDFIIISYACWASLIIKNKNLKNAKVFIDTHDFLTSQFQNVKKFKLGKYFETEIGLLSHFDEIFVISVEEKYIFKQFIDKPIHILPHLLNNNFNKDQVDKTYDIIYVASNNEHNIKSINWFLEEVYPLLNKSIKILVVGKIINHFNDFDTITKMEHIQDLKAAYHKSKIAICPILSGTGLKIKVVEALSFGLPIVSSENGVDGMINKTNNGCLVSNCPIKFAENIEKLVSDEEFYMKNSLLAQNYFFENNDVKQMYSKIDKFFNL